MFNRFRKEDSEPFDFLGFEFRWVTSRRGKDIITCCRMRALVSTLPGVIHEETTGSASGARRQLRTYNVLLVQSRALPATKQSTASGGGNLTRLWTSPKRQRRIIKDLKAWVGKYQNKRLWWILGMVKAKLRGLYNYFDVIGNSTKLQEMYILYKETLFRLLNRRSQRKSFNKRTFTYILNQHGIVRHRSQLFNTGIQQSFMSQLV